MLETTDSLLPTLHHAQTPKAVCVGIDADSLDELKRLLTTLGLDAVAEVLVTSRRISPATFIGQGKIEEIKKLVQEIEVQVVIVDVELSPNQLRNLEKEIHLPILDRPGVIIEIFSRHAQTRESKTQVALARLQYLLPRLAHFWTHFERQRGGSPGSRGMGEKQIEVDRRLVKNRIALLRDRLATIEQGRKIQRAGRKDFLKVALVGYTNAGKSTLLNALTHSHVRAEDRLFATLDPSVRALDPHSHPPIVAIDTVGFIHQLPPTLVASFRSTLEELQYSDLLVHVVDATHKNAREQLEVTKKILKDLGLEEKPMITVLNKVDQAPRGATRNQLRLISPKAVMISSLDPKDVDHVRSLIVNRFRESFENWDVVIPYGESKLDSQLHAYSHIEVTRHLEKGTFYRVKIEKGWANKLNLRKYRLASETDEAK